MTRHETRNTRRNVQPSFDVQPLEKRAYLSQNPYELGVFKTNGALEGDGITVDLNFQNAPSLPNIIYLDSYPWESGIDFNWDGMVAVGLQTAGLDNGENVVISCFNGIDEDWWEWDPELLNVAPTATIDNNGPGSVGAAITVTLENIYDPSPIDAASLRYDFSRSEAGLVNDYGSAGSSASEQFTFVTADIYRIWARVFDKDGGQNTYSTYVSIEYPIFSPPVEGGNLIPIPGTLNDDIFEVWFGYEGGQRSVEWIRNGGLTQGPFEFGPGDTIQIDGFSGDDDITVFFDGDYIQSNANPGDEITILINGGYGNDTFKIYGGPGTTETTPGVIWVNGLDQFRSVWNEVGDLDFSESPEGEYGIDTVNIFAMWGHILFDDGDGQNPEVLSDWRGAEDPVFIDDSAFARWTNSVWGVTAAATEPTDGNFAVQVNRLSATGGFESIINGGHSLDPVHIVAGDGDDTLSTSSDEDHLGSPLGATIEMMGGNDIIRVRSSVVSIDGGEGDDEFHIYRFSGAPFDYEDDIESLPIFATLIGGSGDDSFTIGSPLVQGGPDASGVFVTIVGGDGSDSLEHDEVVFDDSDGRRWGWWGLQNQEKRYIIGQSSFELRTLSQSIIEPVTSVQYTNVDRVTLWAQQNAVPTRELTSVIDVEGNMAGELVINGGVEVETFDIILAHQPVVLNPGGGFDLVNVGTDGGGGGVRTHVTFVGSATIGTLSVGAFGTVVLASGGTNVLRVGNLDIAAGGLLDITDNAIIMDYAVTSPIFDISELIRDGDITSADIVGDSSNWQYGDTRIGLGEASTLGYTEFMGQTVGDAVLIRLTYVGDCDLDKDVDKADLGLMAQHWNLGSGTWYWMDGNFNFDDVVDVRDLYPLSVNWLIGT